MVEESKMKIDTNQKIYLLAYILPYEREDGTKSWCDVGTSGGDLEKWGEKCKMKSTIKIQNGKKMQNSKGKILNAKGKSQNAKC